MKSRDQLESSNYTSAGNSFIAIDPDYFKIGWLRPPVEKVLGLDGDRDRRMIVGEMTLLALREEAGIGGTGYVARINPNG